MPNISFIATTIATSNTELFPLYKSFAITKLEEVFFKLDLFRVWLDSKEYDFQLKSLRPISLREMIAQVRMRTDDSFAFVTFSIKTS